ncbi:helix-turn-helix domain-containing protein [Halobacillus sp. B23F22_1]|uniref:helix-turn-helix domain-containing protein n=1 Tax=Halobacillus sp. B23F22_1 TaxID=3459514 RepID=UPI00373EBE0B
MKEERIDSREESYTSKEMSEHIKVARVQFGRNVQIIRNKKNLSLEQLGEKTGLGQETLEKIEKGDLEPELSFDDLIDLSIGLNVHLMELYEGM